MKLPIPVNIITGSLGSGKTTTISHCLKLKENFAPAERWAILVNEFGSLGIDGSLLEAANSNFSVEGADKMTSLTDDTHWYLSSSVASQGWL
jgi:G3E family GTPase